LRQRKTKKSFFTGNHLPKNKYGLQKTIKVIKKNAPNFSATGEAMKKTHLYIIIIGIGLLAALFGWLFFFGYLETEKPKIELAQEISLIGKNKKAEIIFSDNKSGLADLKVELVQDEKRSIVFDEKISARRNKQKIVSFTINAQEASLNDGPATLNISATDHSLFRNETVFSRQVIIDTKPPQILMSGQPSYFSQGGTGFFAYLVSKSPEQTGIYVNDSFTPANKTIINNKTAYIAYLAMPLEATKENTRVTIYARDEAGNETRIVPSFFIKVVNFRSDSVVLKESFLRMKMPEFQVSFPQLQDKSLAESFEYINSRMRADNDKKIQEICQKSAANKLWDGTFLRMRNAATMAKFGDRRNYIIDGKTLGNSIHLGVDLASTANAPIEAANNGIVVFAQELGIYGNAVIIDHGQGLFSLYAHLSSINTSVGKNVKKEERIGYSGLTGLAGGDHLHFSIIVAGQFVNPLEWWDYHWIENNINKKMRF
jgi:murein DD-endopeptidase MepM/ murein hydrolase activator NlpD